MVQLRASYLSISRSGKTGDEKKATSVRARAVMLIHSHSCIRKLSLIQHHQITRIWSNITFSASFDALRNFLADQPPQIPRTFPPPWHLRHVRKPPECPDLSVSLAQRGAASSRPPSVGRRFTPSTSMTGLLLDNGR